MSVVRLQSGWLAIRPRVWLEGDCLWACTSPLFALLTLFACLRSVCVDRRYRRVEISRRILWLFSRTEVHRFEDVDCVTYEYAELPTSGVVTTGGAIAFDALERYRVGLILKRPRGEFRHLFDFAGEGAVASGFGGVLLGDDWLDLAGDQQQTSLRFVDLLGRFLGVPVGAHNRTAYP